MSYRRVVPPILAALLFCATNANAGEAVLHPDGSTTWQAGIDGIVIEWAPNGTVESLTSKFVQSLAFRDQAGIRKAQTIAEEKAKAAIARFINQTTVNSRGVLEIDKDVTNATRQRQGSQDNTSRTDSRTLINTLTEATASLAAANLSGIIIVERGNDAETGWTIVGFSRKTRRAAEDLKQMMTNAPSSGHESSSTSAPRSLNQPSDVQRYPTDNWRR
jgi:hypothetical protein